MNRPHPLLTLQPVHTALGAVDGLWSPCSRDLVTEIDRIILQLSDVIGPITRVIYRINDWTLISPATASIHKRDVRLEGYWRPKYATNTFIGKRGLIELATLMPASPPPSLETPTKTRYSRARRRVHATA